MPIQPSQYSFYIPAGLAVSENIGFAPTVAIVSNYTPFYIYFPDGVVFCPPWTAGAIIPLSHATRARANWTQSPFGVQVLVAAPVGMTYTASILFSNDPNLSLSGGSPIEIPLDTRSVSFTAAPGATITTGALVYATYGCRVDNFTGTWYQLGTTGILIPPFTTGFTVDLIPPISSLIVAPTTPPYGPANNTNGTQLTVTLYANKIGNYGGSTNVPSGSTPFLAPFAVDKRGLNVFVLETPSKNIELSQLMFTAPSVAQAYSIYRLTAASNGGVPFTPTPLNPSGPAWAGQLLRPHVDDAVVVNGTHADSAAASVTSIATTLPAVVNANDILVVVVSCWPTVSSFVAPAGFTLQQALYLNGGLAVFTRLADGSESGASVTVSWTTARKASINTFKISNVNSAAYMAGVTTASANAANSTPPAITPTGNVASIVFTVWGSGGIAITGSATPAGTITLYNSRSAANTTNFAQYNYTNGDILTWGASTHLVTDYHWISFAIALIPLTVTLGGLIATTAVIPVTVTTTVNVPTLVGAEVLASSGAAGGLVLVAPARVSMGLSVTLKQAI